MKRLNFGREKGDTDIGTMLVFLLLIILVASFLPIMSSSNVSSAKATLIGQGYVVLAAGEYSDLMILLNSVDTKADTAVSNAEAAVVAAQIAAAKVDLYNSARRYVFPDTSNVVVTFTAPVAVDTFSDWAEIVDGDAVTLSSKFSAAAGYLAEMVVEDFSATGKSYIVEIAYGDAKTPVAVKRFLAENEGQELQIRSCLIPAGETLYYRMMCETTVATCEVCFRYFYE